MPIAKTDNINIYYEIEGEGPPLVLVPGFATSLEVWKAFGYVEALRDDYKLILIDPRGHGKSDKPHDPEAYTTEHRISDVIAVLDTLGFSSTHYFGYSYGGRIGLQLAKFAPERIRSLIILSANARGRNYDSWNPIRQLLEEGPEAILDRFEQSTMIPEDIKTRLLTNDLEALIAANKSAMPDLEGDLPNMTMPFLILIGEADGLNPCQELQQVFRQLPDLTFLTLPGLDHTQTWYRSDLVLPHVKAFLGRVSKR